MRTFLAFAARTGNFKKELRPGFDFFADACYNDGVGVLRPKEEMRMKRELYDLFLREGISCAEAIAYRDVREIKHEILAREPFTPETVLIFLLPYYAGETVNLSRYAASLDYHICIRELTARLIASLGELYPGYTFRGFGDHSPIDERSAALVAGLGIVGDNGLLIHERYGSYIFIADILTDLPPERVGAIPPRPVLTCEHCGACRRCCPTGILRGEGEWCLSAITQRKGELTAEEIECMRANNTVWGCDVCQSVCPHNRAPQMTPIAFFHEDRIPLLTRERLDEMDDATFARRAFAWRKRKTVERNLDALGY